MADWYDILREKGIDIPELDAYQTERDDTKYSPVLALADEAIDALVAELEMTKAHRDELQHINEASAFSVLLEAKRLKNIAKKMGVNDELFTDVSWME